MYDVQIFQMVSEGHLAKELNKKAEEGWRIVSTAHDGKRLVVTWQRPT